MLHTDVAKNWLRIDGFFRLFEGLVVSSVEIPELYSYFLGKNLIALFIDFILEKSSPLSIYPKKYSLGTKQNPANCSYAIRLIFFLFQRVIYKFILELRPYRIKLRSTYRIENSTIPSFR